jgi:hypothetical protein
MQTEIKRNGTEVFFSKELKESLREAFESQIKEVLSKESLYLGSLKTEDETGQQWSHYFEIVGHPEWRYYVFTRLPDGGFDSRPANQIPDHLLGSPVGNGMPR